jgi:hypothetical protein
MYIYEQEDKPKRVFYINGEIIKDKTEVYCVAIEDSTSDEAVKCIEEMYSNPRISSLFDKVIGYCIDKISGYEGDSDCLYVVITAMKYNRNP